MKILTSFAAVVMAMLIMAVEVNAAENPSPPPSCPGTYYEFLELTDADGVGQQTYQYKLNKEKCLYFPTFEKPVQPGAILFALGLKELPRLFNGGPAYKFGFQAGGGRELAARIRNEEGELCGKGVTLGTCLTRTPIISVSPPERQEIVASAAVEARDASQNGGKSQRLWCFQTPMKAFVCAVTVGVAVWLINEIFFDGSSSPSPVAVTGGPGEVKRVVGRNPNGRG